MPTTQADELELVRRAQGGDRNAFSDLVCAYSRGVLNVVYRMCGDQQLAEDAAQETFMRAWQRLPSFRPGGSLRSWLYRIGVNAAVDMLRKEKHILPQAVEDLHLSDAQPGPETLAEDAESVHLVRGAIVSLPDASRAVLVLREFEGLSYQEISEALDIPVGTVMSRLNYARKLLKEKIQRAAQIADPKTMGVKVMC